MGLGLYVASSSLPDSTRMHHKLETQVPKKEKEEKKRNALLAYDAQSQNQNLTEPMFPIYSSSLPVAVATSVFSSTCSTAFTSTFSVGCQFSAFNRSDRIGCEKW